MAEVIATLTIRKRWWFHAAYAAGIAAYVLRLLNDERAERYIAWMIDKGVVFDVR
jgi:hypothetical protein